jgi:hypothetical protein
MRAPLRAYRPTERDQRGDPRQRGDEGGGGEETLAVVGRDVAPLHQLPRILVRVEDAALPAPLFGRLARAVRALGTEHLRRTYQTTFWFDLGAPAALPEEVACALGGRLTWPGRGAVSGVEWWLSRMRTSDVGVDFHLYRDERRFQRTGVEVHPAFSSVLFLNRCRGGLLAVTTEPANDANPARAPDRLDVDLVRPWPNRLAIFPGDATHGVLDANGDVPHGRLPVATPLRLALIMNGWRRRPEGVPTFAEAGRYRGLATGPARPDWPARSP